MQQHCPMSPSTHLIEYYTLDMESSKIKSFFNTEMWKFHHSTAICKNIVNDFRSKIVTPRAEGGLSS
jgi:hypothetical protein